MKFSLRLVLVVITILVMVLLTSCTLQNWMEASNQPNDATSLDQNTLNNDDQDMDKNELQDQEQEQNKINREITINIGLVEGPESATFAHVIANSELQKLDYNFIFTYYESHENAMQAIIDDEVDFVTLTPELVAQAYQKSRGKILLSGLTNLGMLYVVEDGDNVTDIDDLAGRRVLVDEANSFSDLVLKYLLNAANLSNTVQIEYAQSDSDLLDALASSQNALGLVDAHQYALLQQRNPRLRLAVDLNYAWQRQQATEKNNNKQLELHEIVKNHSLSMGALAVRREFATAYPQVVVYLQDQLKHSADLINADSQYDAHLVVQYGFSPSNAVAQTMVPLASVVFVDSNNAKDILSSLYKALYSVYPRSIGGSVPDEDFYWGK